MTVTNWAGNVTFGARALHRPSSVDEVRQLVAGADRIRALGTRHSFNTIADTTGDQISLGGLPRVVDIDSAAGQVYVSAGLRYGEVAPLLHAAGWALPNLGSLPHISVAGACSTGTHGSGVTLGGLATAVSSMEVVRGSGDLVSFSRGDADFEACVVGLGAFGVVTSLTLDLEPTFDVAQYVYERLPLADLLGALDEVLGAAYSVSLFTDWSSAVLNQVWLKHRLDEPFALPTRWLGATRADGMRHPVDGFDPSSCTAQQGESGPWHERLPHFRLDFTPSVGEELQSEYFVPRESAAQALSAIDSLRELIHPVLLISEIRTVAADSLWLSPAYGRDSLAIHFTWVNDVEAVAPVLAEVESRLAPLDARPHWGKLFTPELASRYPRLRDFADLVGRHDPTGKFGNAFLESVLK